MTKTIGRGKAPCKVCGAYKNASWALVAAQSTTAIVVQPAADERARPWFWEGNVQARIVENLERSGYTIGHTENTATREAGTDIVARSADGRVLWVTVKGFPEKSALVQARHWFAGALLDVALYRGVEPRIELAVGLPDFQTFRTLVSRVTWLMSVVPFSVFWVAESGTVRMDSRKAALT
jgi:hypothetical protein